MRERRHFARNPECSVANPKLIELFSGKLLKRKLHMQGGIQGFISGKNGVFMTVFPRDPFPRIWQKMM